MTNEIDTDQLAALESGAEEWPTEMVANPRRTRL